MWICNDCGYVFHEPTYTHWEENHGNGFYEPWCAKTCPDCGGSDIDEIDTDYIADSLREMRFA